MYILYIFNKYLIGNRSHVYALKRGTNNTGTHVSKSVSIFIVAFYTVYVYLMCTNCDDEDDVWKPTVEEVQRRNTD